MRRVLQWWGTEFRTSDTYCDHCGTQRTRKDVYVLRHENGSYVQVGRTCLKDFLGHASPYAIAEMAEILCTISDMCREAEERDFSAGGTQGLRYWPLEDFLTTVACVVRMDGWLSRSTARAGGQEATADTALWMLQGPSRHDSQRTRERRARYQQTVEDRVHAVDAVEWARQVPVDPANDFMWNLRVTAGMEVINYKTSGVAAAIIRCFIVAKERELRYKKRMLDFSKSEYFGEPKKRGDFVVTLRDTMAVGELWPSLMHRWITPEGNLAVWFMSGDGGSSFEPGKTYRVKATVKGHEDYKGIKQTVLTRVKLISEVVEAQAQAAA